MHSTYSVQNRNLNRRFPLMVVGILIMGLGISLFKLSLMGNDPNSAMVMAIGDTVGISFAITLISANCLFFLAQVLFDRSLIGVGTFFNWLCVGPISAFYSGIISALFPQPETLPLRILIMAAGILVLSFSAACYQCADLGIAPYDSLSIILSRRLPIPYFWCRIFTDSLCTVLCLIFGGLVGLGTLICAVGLGPFINFFSEHFAKPLLRE